MDQEPSRTSSSCCTDGAVIPYVTDQLAMARLPRATFALMLAILPATATGIGLVVAGVALHHDP